MVECRVVRGTFSGELRKAKRIMPVNFLSDMVSPNSTRAGSFLIRTSTPMDFHWLWMHLLHQFAGAVAGGGHQLDLQRIAGWVMPQPIGAHLPSGFVQQCAPPGRDRGHSGGRRR